MTAAKNDGVGGVQDCRLLSSRCRRTSCSAATRPNRSGGPGPCSKRCHIAHTDQQACEGNPQICLEEEPHHQAGACTRSAVPVQPTLQGWLLQRKKSRPSRMEGLRVVTGSDPAGALILCEICCATNASPVRGSGGQGGACIDAVTRAPRTLATTLTGCDRKCETRVATIESRSVTARLARASTHAGRPVRGWRGDGERQMAPAAGTAASACLRGSPRSPACARVGSGRGCVGRATL